MARLRKTVFATSHSQLTARPSLLQGSRQARANCRCRSNRMAAHLVPINTTEEVPCLSGTTRSAIRTFIPKGGPGR